MGAAHASGGESWDAAPLAAIGDHEVWPMRAFPDEVVAEVYARSARRGNPVLAGASDEALLRRGREMAMHSKGHRCAYVATVDGRPAAVNFAWDAADEPAFTPDPTLAVHSALHGVVHASRAERIAALGPHALARGTVLHHAYAGVVPGYPASLMVQIQHLHARTMLWLGYKYTYGCAVHPVTAAGARNGLPAAWRWEVPFASVVLPDGTRPLLGKAPHAAVASLSPVWAQGGMAALIPHWALPHYIRWTAPPRKRQGRGAPAPPPKASSAADVDPAARRALSAVAETAAASAVAPAAEALAATQGEGAELPPKRALPPLPPKLAAKL
eukprot:TRINITY_DN13045_c0_g2_i1.p1 TRINITY_DN13045_c0_g2~~TRINITY_DN13045_c0_g2_i1.p1  ORF type:complete len:352 (+),score=98.31 TRINITY_DN13045_c0_g2_i1:75-1058(+)